MFLDLFAGGGVVSRMAKQCGYCVVASDWEPYSEAINQCYIAANEPPAFATLGGYQKALATLNALPPLEGWITRHLCPHDDKLFNIKTERMFYTRANGLRLDAAREQIGEWFQDGRIDQAELACLLTPLLYTACYVSNTSGVFKGFHNGWGGQIGTALYRICSHAELRPATFYDNGRDNQVLRGEATRVATQLRAGGVAADIVYLDPPYNQHPYGSNYHVLNTLTLWDGPVRSERIEGRNKSAIREDWRTERRSAYNYRHDAERDYAELMTVLDARAILTSYKYRRHYPPRIAGESELGQGPHPVRATGVQTLPGEFTTLLGEAGQYRVHSHM